MGIAWEYEEDVVQGKGNNKQHRNYTLIAREKKKKGKTRKTRIDMSALGLAACDDCEPGKCHGSSWLT